MSEFFIELFSEEIPARMQARGADDLARLLGEALAALAPRSVETFYGPRRIALAAEVAGSVPESRSSERGPRRNAPEQALTGFLRKHGAAKGQLREEGDFWVLDKVVPGVDAAALVAAAVPAVLRKFPWPKSMRWGGSSGFTWVRPLRRIVCLLDGAVVPFDLRDGVDDGHGLVSDNLTEGHRFLSPGAFAVTGCTDWAEKLRARHVIVQAAERRALIDAGLASLAAAEGLRIVRDEGLLDEVTGLVEWPVPYLGRIDAAYMDLPAEVMQVSMRVNQRYFALCDANSKAAARFAFIANIPPTDGGAAMVAGNERVLRARFADARHFWDLDRNATLESRVAALDKVTFHAKLGTQGDRVRRIEKLSLYLADHTRAHYIHVRRAARLAKADLSTGMVGEFPELQGVMGGYYALADGEDRAVALAIQDHYSPKGPSDEVPRNQVGLTVALADKIDMLVGFFAIGEKPTGSGDPFALRRAALGVIRIVRERKLRLPLRSVIDRATESIPGTSDVDDVFSFLIERLRVQIRSEGGRYDALNAVLTPGHSDDLLQVLSRFDAISEMLGTEAGENLIAGYRRATKILDAEEKKNGAPFEGEVNERLFVDPSESDLNHQLVDVRSYVNMFLNEREYRLAAGHLARLRQPLDTFFSAVTVNNPEAQLRHNRLLLLSRVRETMHSVADFARIEG